MHFFPYLLFFYFFFNVCMRVGPDQTEFLNVARFFPLFWTNEYQPAKEYEKNKEQKRADNYVILQPNDPLFFSNVWYMYDVSIRDRARTIVSSVSALHEIEKRLIFFVFLLPPSVDDASGASFDLRELVGDDHGKACYTQGNRLFLRRPLIQLNDKERR
jgi:hypothetical protein